MSKFLLISIKFLLFLTLLTPLIVVGSLPYPFVYGKMVFYRIVIEAALVLALILVLIRARDNFNSIVLKVKHFFRSPLFLLIIGFFIVSAFISTLVAPVFFKAFFGEVERGEGFLAYLHYIIFLIIAVSIFSRRDWFLFFKVAVGVGIAVSLLAWLQFLGVDNLPLGLKTVLEQPGSSLGNPSYLAAFMILLLALIAVLFRDFESSRRFKLFLGFTALFFIATIFITAVRGAILGLALGLIAAGILYIFSRNTPKIAKKAGIALVVLVVLFGGIFWATRGSGIWNDVPGLGRFARVSFDIPSASTRIIGAGVSFEAWKDKPIFGWGIEHYNVAYNQNYNPAYEAFAEEWFDRAHNKITEVAVIQGGFGLVLYLGILGLTLWLSRRNPLLFGAFLAYIIQNLFLFDIPTSYLIVFPLWGYLISRKLEQRPKEVEETAVASLIKVRGWIPKFALPTSFVIITVAIFYHLYAYIYVPLGQASTYRSAMRTGEGVKVLEASDKFLYPYNYLQPTLRAFLIDKLFDSKLIRNKDFRPLVIRALEALEETAEREKYEPRQYIRLGENYNELAKDEERFFEESLPFVERAFELAPRRQGAYHLKAFTLSGLGRFDEAVEVVRQAVVLEPRNYKTYYNLGLNAALASHAPQYKATPVGEEYEKEALEAIDRSLEIGKSNDYIFFSKNDIENLKIILTRLGAYREAARVLEIAIFWSDINGKELFGTKDRQWFIDAMTLYRTLRDSENMIRIAEAMQEEFSEDEKIVEDLDIIIDLARNQNWEILDTL